MAAPSSKINPQKILEEIIKVKKARIKFYTKDDEKLIKLRYQTMVNLYKESDERSFKTGLFTKRAVDLLMVLAAYNAKNEDFTPIPMYTVYRDQFREAVVQFGYSIDRGDVRLPKKIKSMMWCDRSTGRMIGYRKAFLENYSKDYIVQRLQYVLMWRIYVLLKRMKSSNLTQTTINIGINDDVLGIANQGKKEITFSYEEMELIKDVINGYKRKDLIGKYNEELLDSIIGTKADPFVVQMRTNIILESNRLEIEALEKLREMIENPLNLDNKKYKSYFKKKLKIKEDYLQSVIDLWTDSGEEA